MREAARRPQWLDEQLYPFQSRFVEVEGNRIHYIDGEPVPPCSSSILALAGL